MSGGVIATDLRPTQQRAMGMFQWFALMFPSAPFPTAPAVPGLLHVGRGGLRGHGLVRRCRRVGGSRITRVWWLRVPKRKKRYLKHQIQLIIINNNFLTVSSPVFCFLVFQGGKTPFPIFPTKSGEKQNNVPYWSGWHGKSFRDKSPIQYLPLPVFDPPHLADYPCAAAGCGCA